MNTKGQFVIWIDKTEGVRVRVADTMRANTLDKAVVVFPNNDWPRIHLVVARLV